MATDHIRYDVLARDALRGVLRDPGLDVLYAVDPKGDAWGTFQTKTMPTNFLIAKGGKIVSIASGCDPSGLLANTVSEKTGKLLGTTAVDVKSKVETKK